MTNETYDLCGQADKILADAGYTIWGMPRNSVDSSQTWFDNRMQTGAYRNNGDRRR